MIIDMKAVYLTLTVVLMMFIFAIITVKKILSIRSTFTTILLFIEEIIGAGTLGYILSLTYKAMESYDAFLEKYGTITNYFTYISLYFCASQIVIIVLINIYRFIKRHTKMIKKRRIIK